VHGSPSPDPVNPRVLYRSHTGLIDQLLLLLVFFICGASTGFRVMAGLPDLLPPTLALALVSAIERQQATDYVGLTSHFVHFCVYLQHTENSFHCKRDALHEGCIKWDALHVTLLAHRNLK